MAKYIDSEKLITEINKLRYESCIGEVDDGYEFAKSEICDLIDSLQQEQPSLPANVDEAAEKIASDIVPKYPDINWDICFEKIVEGVKAGAKWMAGQGETIETAARID